MQTQEFHQNEAFELIDQAMEVCADNFDLSQVITDLNQLIDECPADTSGKRIWLDNAYSRLERMQRRFTYNDKLIKRLLSCSGWHQRQADRLEREWNEAQAEMKRGTSGTGDRAKRKANQRAKSMAAQAKKDGPWRGQHIGPHGSHSNQPKPKPKAA